jgi:hypothetical protein
MTNLPDDLLDPAEARLARRVRGYTDAAVVPIDPVAIAASAGAARSRRLPTFARFGLLLAGAAALVAVASLSILTIGRAPTSPGTAVPTTGAAVWTTATPTVATATCDSSSLEGRILRWEGAAGSRIATVELSNPTAADCQLMDYELALVDGGGRNQALIIGPAIDSDVLLPAAQTIHTLVEASNFCHPSYVPVEPVSIRLDAASDNETDVVFTPAVGGLSGVPPCNGAGQPGSISQQPWAPGSALAE